MLMLPMRPGERATITTPAGETIIILLSEHRSSLDEPIIGFATPQYSAVLRDRMLPQWQAFLTLMGLYQVTSNNSPEAVIAASNSKEAVRLYLKHYPDSGEIQLLPLTDLTQWYGRLERHWMRRTQLPFLVEGE